MLLDHVFITYSDGSYNETTRIYDPVDPLILAYTKDSLLFDTKRHTIYAQGIEFGYSYTFPYVNSGVGIVGTDISKSTSYYITGIEQNIDGSISYSYSYSYITFGLSDGILDNNSGGSYIIGMAMSDDGKISYKYANVNHTTTPAELSGNSLTNHGIVVDVNINQRGALTYSWYNAATTNDDKTNEGEHDLSGAEYTVVDGIRQDSFGKVSYHTTTIKTTHSGNVNGDFAYDLSLSNDGKLTGKSGVFSNQKTGETTSGVINNVNLDHTGKLSYSYVSLENLLNVTPTGSDDGPHTLQNNTSYQVITNITQNANGSISYTYSNINTTHTSTGVDRDIDDRVITNVHLDADGNFSYSYANHETTTSDRLKAVKVGGDATITLTGPSTSYTFVTQIDQTSDGKIIYTYAYVNTTHTTATSNSNTNKVVTYVNLDSDGNLTYHLTDLSVTSGTAGSNMILTNDDTYKFITGITQASDGKISYTYSQLNTNFTYQGDNVDGPVYELNIDKTGKVSYVHKNLSVDSGVLSNDGDIITNDSTYRFITGISQASDGKISYTYGVFNTDFSNNGTTNGVLTNVNIDNAGHLSYDSVDLTTNSGNYNSVSYNTGVKIVTTDGNPGKPLYTHVINNISQSANGKISYSYVGLYTDLKDYTYHNLTLFGVLPSIQDGNVAVINRISIDNQGIQKGHQLSYTYTQVPTREYVDGLITANDAMRYCGTFTGSGTTLSLSYPDNPDDPDTSKGAVYKCSAACTINGQTFAPGDWIISNKDYASATNITDGWDSFNVNIDIRDVGLKGLNTENTTYVLTNVNALNDGTISYTYSNLTVKNNASTYDNNTNELMDSSYNVITGIKLTQDRLETQLSYQYTKIHVNKNHHSTASAGAGGTSKVIGAVHLSESGELSYSYTDIAKMAYHYTPAWPMMPLPYVEGVITIPYNSGESNPIVSYIQLTYDSKGHLIDSSQAHYSFTHGMVTTSGSNLGQKVITIAAGGTNSDDLKSYTSLTASNGHLTNATYGSYVFKHGAPSGGTTYTVYTGSNEYIKTLSFAYDTNGHITSYSYTLATADFNDEKTKFVSFITNKIYLGGTKTQAGNVTTNTYIDGITYVNNGTIFMEKAIVGNSSDDTISINAKAVTFNEDSTHFDFTGLKALWGVVGQ